MRDERLLLTTVPLSPHYTHRSGPDRAKGERRDVELGTVVKVSRMPASITRTVPSSFTPLLCLTHEGRSTRSEVKWRKRPS